MWRWVVAAVLAAAFIAPLPTRAVPPCGVSISGGLAFGTYDPFSTSPLDTSAIMTLTCPAASAAQITISKGNSTTYAARELSSGSAVLRYNLFLDPGRTVIWGDGTESTSLWAPPKKNAQTTIWGRIPAGQDPVPGTYSDTLVVTVYPY